MLLTGLGIRQVEFCFARVVGFLKLVGVLRQPVFFSSWASELGRIDVR